MGRHIEEHVLWSHVKSLDLSIRVRPLYGDIFLYSFSSFAFLYLPLSLSLHIVHHHITYSRTSTSLYIDIYKTVIRMEAQISQNLIYHRWELLAAKRPNHLSTCTFSNHILSLGINAGGGTCEITMYLLTPAGLFYLDRCTCICYSRIWTLTLEPEKPN